MTLEELELIREIIGYYYDEYPGDDVEKCLFYLDREIAIKKLDPRKETSK